MLLGTSRNDQHDTGARKKSVIDELVFLHNLIEKDLKVTAATKASKLYRGPYVEGKTVHWKNIVAATVYFLNYYKLRSTCHTHSFL